MKPDLAALLAYAKADLQQRRRLRSAFDGKPETAAKQRADKNLALAQALVDRLAAEVGRAADDAEREALRVRLDGIRRQIEWWVRYNTESRAREGLPSDDDTHLIAPPTWPSHGQRQLMDARLTEDEAFGIVAYHPSVSDIWRADVARRPEGGEGVPPNPNNQPRLQKLKATAMQTNRILLDSREESDAKALGYDEPKDPYKEFDGMIIEYDPPSSGNDIPATVELINGATTFNLWGPNEIRETAKALAHAYQLATGKSLKDLIL